jgi:Cu-Zn family superoxide dismutase
MKSPIEAVAVFNEKKIKGIVHFKEDITNNTVMIEINISGLKKNGIHGFHVHEAGDLTDHCESLCAHFNPYNKKHGCPGMKERHVGDLGNLQADQNGVCEFSFDDFLVKLSGKCNVLGRSIVIHEDEDDLGLGDFPDSSTTGHSGKRLACGVIGYRKLCK